MKPGEGLDYEVDLSKRVEAGLFAEVQRAEVPAEQEDRQKDDRALTELNAERRRVPPPRTQPRR